MQIQTAFCVQRACWSDHAAHTGESKPEFGLQQDGCEEAGRSREGLIEDRGAIAQQRQAQRLPQLLTELHAHSRIKPG